MSLLRGVSFDHLKKKTREFTLPGCPVRSDNDVTLILQHAGEENAGWINTFRKIDAATPLKDLTPQQHFDALVVPFCEFVVVGWKDFIGEDGQPVAFTSAGCLELMRAYGEAALDLASRPIFYASYANNFRDFKPPAVDAEALGKA